MQSVTEYPKAGRHAIGYRFSVSDHPDHRSRLGLLFASMEVRRFVLCEYARAVAERVRHGGSNIDHSISNASRDEWCPLYEGNGLKRNKASCQACDGTGNRAVYKFAKSGGPPHRLGYEPGSPYAGKVQ